MTIYESAEAGSRKIYRTNIRNHKNGNKSLNQLSKKLEKDQ